MGLDICAAGNMVPQCALNEWDRDDLDIYDALDENFLIMPSKSYNAQEEIFPGRAEGVEPDVVYALTDVVYDAVGSCSTYNFFRSILNEFDHTLDGGPYFEDLVEFYDCDGIIGPVVAARLYDAFSAYKERFFAYLEGVEDLDEWNVERCKGIYDVFETTCRVAGGTGVIIFC